MVHSGGAQERHKIRRDIPRDIRTLTLIAASL